MKCSTLGMAIKICFLTSKEEYWVSFPVKPEQNVQIVVEGYYTKQHVNE